MKKNFDLYDGHIETRPKPIEYFFNLRVIAYSNIVHKGKGMRRIKKRGGFK